MSPSVQIQFIPLDLLRGCHQPACADGNDGDGQNDRAFGDLHGKELRSEALVFRNTPILVHGG
jgi:hypothetical protein